VSAVAFGKDGDDDRGERDHDGEDVLHDAQLTALAEGHPKQKRRAGIGQRGDETADQDHVRTRIPDRR
jgi:hypothetical protein